MLIGLKYHRNSLLLILLTLFSILQLNGLEKSFYSFYVCTAVRKFFFFLDPMRTGRIKIQDILACSFLDDLLEVCRYIHFAVIKMCKMFKNQH